MTTDIFSIITILYLILLISLTFSWWQLYKLNKNFIASNKKLMDMYEENLDMIENLLKQVHKLLDQNRVAD